MKLCAIASLICAALFVIGCSREPPEEPADKAADSPLVSPDRAPTPSATAAPTPAAGPAAAPAASTTKSPAELIVGTWEYDLKYRSGDVVPCIRIFEKDGTGRQYAVDAGELGAQKFKWTILKDGKAMNLAYGDSALTSLEYAIEKLDETSLIMTPPTAEAKEECKRRVAKP